MATVKACDKCGQVYHADIGGITSPIKPLTLLVTTEDNSRKWEGNLELCENCVSKIGGVLMSVIPKLTYSGIDSHTVIGGGAHIRKISTSTNKGEDVPKKELSEEEVAALVREDELREEEEKENTKR